jgi:hypothetical protein
MTQLTNSKIVGQLSPTDFDPDFFESKPYPFPYFDSKEIKVGFVEAEHQPYLDGADKALENFIGLGLIDRTENSDMVHNYYSETLKYGYTKPLDIKMTKDIWNFVTSQTIPWGFPWRSRGTPW